MSVWVAFVAGVLAGGPGWLVLAGLARRHVDQMVERARAGRARSIVRVIPPRKRDAGGRLLDEIAEELARYGVGSDGRPEIHFPELHK